jgi:hypothetical protein
MKHITIITEDRIGLVADITELMAKAEINIETIDSERINEIGVVTMTVNKHNEALRALANAGFNALSGEIILLKLIDRPGAVAEIAKRFKEASINLHSLRLLRRQGNMAIVAISGNNPEKIRALVTDELISTS